MCFNLFWAGGVLILVNIISFWTKVIILVFGIVVGVCFVNLVLCIFVGLRLHMLLELFWWVLILLIAGEFVGFFLYNN